jgi:hypothetical protein
VNLAGVKFDAIDKFGGNGACEGKGSLTLVAGAVKIDTLSERGGRVPRIGDCEDKGVHATFAALRNYSVFDLCHCSSWHHHSFLAIATPWGASKKSERT